MKRIAPLIIILVLAMVAWEWLADWDSMHFHVNGDEIEGPVEALLGILFAGGGLLIGAVVVVFVGALVAVVFTGLGVMAVLGLALAAVIAAVVAAPLMLPLLLPVAIIWLLVSRSRRKSAT